jgi:predicted DNA-binding transcriptional regulator YafY
MIAKRTPTSNRARTQLRRLLILIDILAPLRLPFTLADAMQRFEDRGETKVSKRTLHRDLELLVSMNLAEVWRKHRYNNRFGTENEYRLNLRNTERAELAAIKICDRVTA